MIPPFILPGLFIHHLIESIIAFGGLKITRTYQYIFPGRYMKCKRLQLSTSIKCVPCSKSRLTAK